MNQIPPEWIRWIDENVLRGVSEKKLIDAMVKAKFGNELAEATIASRTLERIRASAATPDATTVTDAVPKEYRYEGCGLNTGNKIHIDGHNIAVLMKLEKPRAILFGNVLSHDECDQLIALSKTQLLRSGVVDHQTGNTELHEHRTSSGTFFHRGTTPLIAMIDKRLAALMQVPESHGEGLQILNYQIGGEYRPHYDYFRPDAPGSAKHLARGGQRTATLIIYLNDVDGGGETIFPRNGLSIVPAKGSAIYFSYANAENQLDSLSFHGGSPVIEGEKWIATKWVRQNEYR